MRPDVKFLVYFVVIIAVLCAVIHKLHGADNPPIRLSALKIIRDNCIKCHSGDRPANGLRLDSVDNMVRGGKRGPAIVPFKPDESLVWLAVGGTGERVPMMPPFYRLSEAERARVRQWIDQGAIQMSMGGQEP